MDSRDSQENDPISTHPRESVSARLLNMKFLRPGDMDEQPNKRAHLILLAITIATIAGMLAKALLK